MEKLKVFHCGGPSLAPLLNTYHHLPLMYCNDVCSTVNQVKKVPCYVQLMRASAGINHWVVSEIGLVTYSAWNTPIEHESFSHSSKDLDGWNCSFYLIFYLKSLLTNFWQNWAGHIHLNWHFNRLPNVSSTSLCWCFPLLIQVLKKEAVLFFPVLGVHMVGIRTFILCLWSLKSSLWLSVKSKRVNS